MNHCYRLVFNATSQIWQVVSELAKSHRKSKSSKSATVILLPIFSLFASAVWADPAPNALPTGGQVVSGQSIITQNGNLLNIQQTTQKSIINWNTYNIGASSHVNYDQLNSGSISLNRVLSADPSAIFGKLTSNGQVWLINPNGILFGQSAQVNVGGLLASTLNIADDDFLSGNYKFTGGTGSVVNMGNIVANNGGYVAMLAPEVRNEGVVSALQGTVAMAAGDAMTLDFNGNNLINVQVDSANINTLVENKNLIKVGGGQVIMSSKAADGLITSVINNSGRIEADSMVSDGGVVRLTGAKLVTNSGVISAKSSAGKGGTVHMLGDHVGVFGAGSINASGKTGGGTILVGGDYLGGNANIQNAQKTFISQDAKLTADATDTGNGGKVIVWADDITRYYGSISAKGGVNGGNGGFAEVSGKRLLNFLGKADLSAAKGVGGNLLLDPLNITLTTADANTAGFTVPGDLTEAFADDAGLTSTFNVNAGGSFAGIAAGSTITLQATNDINVNTAFDLATATGTANNSLVLQANNNINVNAAVSATGTGAITMAANADNIGGGNLAFGANISSQSGAITLSGVNITRGAAGNITANGAAGANGGNINMTATGAISLGGATVSNNGGGLAAVGGNAGNINIIAGTGFSMTGAIVSSGPASLDPNVAGGNGGNVSITSAAGNISTGAITTTGGNAGAGVANGSNAGNISVVATTGNVTAGALTARTGLASGTGASGVVADVSVSGANVTLAAVNTSGQALSNGNGGTVTVNATGVLRLNGAINSSGGTVITGNAGKSAGVISLTGGSITTAAVGTITASGSNGSGADQAGGNGAAVSLNATGAISTRAITANGGNGVATNAAGGNAGSITIATNAGNITTNAAALSARTGVGIGTGANSVQGFITVNNTSAAGTIATGAITTAGNTNGAGGNISVAGNGNVTIAGTVSSSGGTSTGTRAGRNAGNVTIAGANRSITGAITASGGAGIGTNQAGGNAGAVSINGAGTLNTVAITTSTGARTGSGAGGVAGSIALSGSRITSTALSTAAGAGGVGGNVNVTTTGAATSTITSINANTNGVIAINNSDTLTVTGAIAGTGTTLTKSGAGTLALTGTSTYTGLTTVNTGTLSIGNGGTTGVIANAGGIANSGTVIFNRSNVHSYGGVISGTGVVVKDGAGVFTFSGANTYTGATNILAGTLLDSASIPNSSAVNISLGATLDLNNQSEIVGSIAGAGNIVMGTGNLTSGANNLSTNFSGVISGTGGNFNKQGTGTLTLSGSNTYTGLTQVQAGTLSAANANALGATGAGTTVTSGATLNVDNVTLAAEPITINGNGVGGAGALTGTGAATVTGNITTAAASRIGTTSGASVLTISGAVSSALNAVNIAGAGDVIATNTANDFGSVGITGAKNVSLVDANNLALTTSTLTGNLTAQALGNITLTNAVSTTGGDISLAGVSFINNAGASALSASGRWLVYANAHNVGNTFGGLLSANQAIWNTSYPTAVSQTGNRYVFANNPGTLTVTSTNQTKTYGQNGAPIVASAYNVTGTFVNAATFGSVFTQDTVANTVTGSATSTGSAVTANVGSYAIDVTPVTATTGYTLTKNSTGNLTANPAVVNLAGTRIYDATTAFNAGVFGTFATGINGEDLNLSGAGSVASANVGAAQTLTTGTLALTNGTGLASNYTLTGGTHTGTITPAALTVTGATTVSPYTSLAQTNTFSSTGLLGADSVTAVTGLATGTNVATYADNLSAATGSGLGNYTISYVNGSLQVTPVALTVTANNATKLQGNANPPFSSSFVGFVGGETSAVLTGLLDHSTPATAASPVGSYAITPFGLSATNYAITFVDGVLTVSPIAPPPASPSNITALVGGLTRPEQAQQTCGEESAGNTMISGLDVFGVDDVEYKESVSQPLVGSVVANALVSPSCTKL
jgi:trimeric autotransporter adhesin